MTNSVSIKIFSKGSVGAKVAMLIKHLATVIDLNFENSEKISIQDIVWWEYEWIRNASDIDQYILKRKKAIRPYGKNEAANQSIGFLDATFLLGLAFYYSVNGNEKAAWETLVDAAWHAGYATKNEKTGEQIRIAEKTVVHRKSSKAAKKGHAKALKTQAKKQIKSRWKKWQKLAKKDPEAAQKQYENKTAFAHDMLNQFTVLAGHKSGNPGVVMGWMTLWEKLSKKSSKKKI